MGTRPFIHTTSADVPAFGPGLSPADAKRVEGALQALTAMHCYATLQRGHESPELHDFGDEVRKLVHDAMEDLRLIGRAEDDVPEPYLRLVTS